MADKPTTTDPGQRCAKCGACAVVCPVVRASGGKEIYSGRGKKHLLEVMGEAKPSPVFEDIFAKCLLCGACVGACPRGVDIPAEVRRARSSFGAIYGEHGYQKYLARKVLEHPGLLGVVRTFGRSFADLLARRLPSESGLRLQLAMFAKGPIPEPKIQIPRGQGHADLRPMTFFPGCSAGHLCPETASAVRLLAARAGYEAIVPEGLTCCGLAIDSSGDRAGSVTFARRNIEALELGTGPVLVACGSCYAHLRRYPELFADDPSWRERAEKLGQRLVEICQFLDSELPQSATSQQQGETGRPKLRVFYHDPCHLRHELKITREPRRLLQRYDRVELLELADGPQCCGHGGLFHIGASLLAATIRDDLAAKVLQLAPDVVTSSCSGCLMQWRAALAAADLTTPVLHLAELLLMLDSGRPLPENH